jgi:type VI secretion system protein VasG
MIATSIRAVLEKLNKYTRTLLEGAVGACVTRGHYEVTLSHLLSQAMEEGKGDFTHILAFFKVNGGLVKSALQQDLKELRTGNTGKPVFSPTFMGILESAWAESSLNLNQGKIRTAALILAARRNPGLVSPGLSDLLAQIPLETLITKFSEVTAGSKETDESPEGAGRGADGAPAEGSALQRFTQNLTEQAREGKMDPIFGRDDEIRMVIDILSRRRKNNPILVGEAGVGKTAVVEGLALSIAEGKVPDILKNVEIRCLDMGLMQAGAGVRGEFENRLKSVIKEVKSSPKPVILFIDETHSIFGAGGEQGTGDAANLLKPEMARGELKIIGATTLTEFRKYFEKDPAMARRFQMVNVPEPTPESAAIMLRGLRGRYESFHGVKITYEGIKSACDMSNKYIAGRQLPDKAVDLLDTAAARVKMGLTAPPAALVNLEQSIENLKIEISALEKDDATGALTNADSLPTARGRLATAQENAMSVKTQWEKELAAVKEIIVLQDQIQSDKTEAPQKETLRTELEGKWKALEEMQGEVPLVHAHVAPAVVAAIISEWTGIPAGNMLKNEAQALLELEKTVTERVVGQHQGVAEIAASLRSAKLGLTPPEKPMGVFLITGPSGVGKTEVAMTIADILFGGEKNIVTINMSEYQDSMSVTQLKGASAGYVGYGDGGVLTEGVRKRPYTVVILDEVEKAHKDVLNMFYQVFDKGALRDGEGRDISFRNTVIIMTSNLGLGTITDMWNQDPDTLLDQYRQSILQELTDHFQPALLARCKVVPFLPLGPDNLGKIVVLKLMKLGRRLMDRHKLAFAVAPDVVRVIVQMCNVSQSGARNIDNILDQRLMPEISRHLLSQMADNKIFTHLFIGISSEGFDPRFSVGDFDMGEEVVAEEAGDEATEAADGNTNPEAIETASI